MKATNDNLTLRNYKILKLSHPPLIRDICSYGEGLSYNGGIIYQYTLAETYDILSVKPGIPRSLSRLKLVHQYSKNCRNKPFKALSEMVCGGKTFGKQSTMLSNAMCTKSLSEDVLD